MKQLLIVITSILLMTSCFEKTPLEAAEHIPIDSICHYYAIEVDEADSVVSVTFSSWPVADRDKRLKLPTVDKVEINQQILNLENNSYKVNIPIQAIKNDVITISYFSSDTVFYTKRIKLARFTSCKVIFDVNGTDSMGVSYEPALNMFEELDITLKSKTTIHKKFSYNESIRNGFTFKEGLINNSGKYSGTPTIQLEKKYEEKYSEPMSILIRTSTRIQRDIRYEPTFDNE